MSTGFDPIAVRDKLMSHAMASGYFARVNGHEPKNAPGLDLTCAIWIDEFEPIRSSGLASTSIKVSYNIRVYNPMLAEPQDDIDPNVLSAIKALYSAYIGAFTLGGEARHIDVHGAHGQPLRAKAGYLNQDKRQYRVMVIYFPVIFNDVFEQVA